MKCLVFTSVGDNSKFDSYWIGNGMKYDICAIYYGNNDNLFSKYKDNPNIKYCEKRKGDKYWNFKYFYDSQKEVIEQYDYFFILDDDIIFYVEDINSTFEIADMYKLDICGPSFLPSGITSHTITKHKPDVLLTYTNFVEMNTPCFNKKALAQFMMIYDGELFGWGIDYLYILVNGIDEERKYAIIHSITCINPTTESKGCVRELSLVPGYSNPEDMWINFARNNNYPILFELREYYDIPIHYSKYVKQIDKDKLLPKKIKKTHFLSRFSFR
jgi:hypothetical protein